MSSTDNDDQFGSCHLVEAGIAYADALKTLESPEDKEAAEREKHALDVMLLESQAIIDIDSFSEKDDPDSRVEKLVEEICKSVDTYVQSLRSLTARIHDGKLHNEGS